MMQRVWAGQFADVGSLANLRDLRHQLTERLALLLIAGSGLALWAALPQGDVPLVVFELLICLLLLGIAVRGLVPARPAVARHLLVWGLTAALLAAMGLFFDPWLPFLGLLLTFIGAMLVSGGEIFTAGTVATAALWLTRSGLRLYPMIDLLVGLVLSVALAWLVVRTLYTALQWAWSMQQQADQLLDQVRDRQAELGRVLKSSELANSLLRRTQHELIAARRQADQARRLKEQFAANISHELRTPLNLILGFSELMYLWPDVYGPMEWPANLRRAVYQVYRSSRHLLGMIDDILDLSRFEMAGFTLDREPTPLGPLLLDAAGIVEDLFRSGPVRLEVDIAPDMPVVDIDRTRMRQVLLNLLNNALRFTTEGYVRLNARQAGDEVIISVSDTGPGIPAEKQPFVFDEFYQVDLSLRRQHQGAGLGLAISKRFVQAHKGRIWVESCPGQGSTFFVALPAPGHPPSLPPHLPHLQEAQWPEPRPALVLVDPDPALGALLERHLAEYNIVQLQNTADLAGTIALHHPRAVICNSSPEESHGRPDFPPVPVPYIECSLPSQAWISRELAVTACLTKPVTAQQLIGEIERLNGIKDVLIIDDDRGFGHMVELFLKTPGRQFNVRLAYDGERGLLAARSRRPDLVLLDLGLPGMDGFQVLAELRSTPETARIPVIVLTASSYADDLLKRRGQQMVVYRSDGLAFEEVLHCLRAITGALEPQYAGYRWPESEPARV